MTAAAGQVFEVTDADFDGAVVERSHDTPILVDFWAPWCGPCRMLGPVLEQIAAERAGAVEVVKLNTDDNPRVASRYGISSIPAVKLFHGGKVVGEFVGALPAPRVRAFLDQHLPTEASQAAARAALALATGDAAGARAAAEASLTADPEGAGAGAAHLVLARLGLAARELDAADAHVRAIPAAAPEWDAAQAILAAIELGRAALAAGDPAALDARLAADPGDHEAAFARAIHHLLDGDLPAALDGLLGLVERARKWNDEAARKAMLVIFSLAGIRSPLSDAYRHKLALLL
ncbi:MAG: thioredoxin [Kofleriaceae bacterium]|nr:thioredoxin [Kofleriaceae bacterium]